MLAWALPSVKKVDEVKSSRSMKAEREFFVSDASSTSQGDIPV